MYNGAFMRQKSMWQINVYTSGRLRPHTVSSPVADNVPLGVDSLMCEKFLRSFCLAAQQQLLFPLPTQTLLPRGRWQLPLLCLVLCFFYFPFFHRSSLVQWRTLTSDWMLRQNNSCVTTVYTDHWQGLQLAKHRCSVQVTRNPTGNHLGVSFW